MNWNEMADAWTNIQRQGWDSWLAMTDPTVQQVAGQFLASQDAMLRFARLVIDTWATISTQQEDWQGALRAAMEQMRVSPQAVQDTAELWSLYLTEWERLGQLWLEPFKQAWAQQQDVSSPIELTNLYWDAFERTFGTLLKSPGLGYTHEMNERIARGFDRWLDFRRASTAYQAKLADIWAEAFEQLIREMASLAEKGQSIDSVRALLLLWGQVADRVFIETFRTDEYVRIQGEMLNAAMAYRIEQRAIMENVLKVYDLPTRSEVDEAHYHIYELRKEIKALKKQVAALQQPKPPRRRKPASTSAEE